MTSVRKWKTRTEKDIAKILSRNLPEIYPILWR